MQWREFKTQVEAQGVKLPQGWGGNGGRPESYVDFAGLGHPGSGNPRNFSNYDVRLAVSWAKVQDLAGNMRRNSEMSQWAAQVLALNEDGWVIMSDGQVWWTDHPTKQVFDRGAICIPGFTLQ